MKEEEEEEEIAAGLRESGSRIRSSKQAVHAAISGNVKTICGWRFARDVGWSIQQDGEPVTCGKCLLVLRQRESRIPGLG